MRYGYWLLGAMFVLGACQGQERPDPGAGSDSDPGADAGPGSDPASDPASGSAQLEAADGSGQVIAELGFADDDTAVVSVANRGTAASRALALALVGDGSADFVIDPASSCPDRVLGPTEACTITVHYEPTTEALRTGTLTIGDYTQVALRPVPQPRLQIVITGGGIGEVTVTDEATFTHLATCTASCGVRAKQGQVLEIDAATPSIPGGLSGACTNSGPSCEVTLGAGISVVTATFTTDPKELWTVLPKGAPITSAAFDGAGNLITAAKGITKRSPTGAVLWQIALAACAVATGPDGTIYAETASQIVKLAPDGTTVWSQPLDPHATGCGGTEGFVHNLAVGSDGAVAIHGDTGVTRWDAGGNLSWTAAVSAGGEHGVAIDPQGAVDVAVLSPLSGEPIDLVRFAADGTPLPGVDHVTSQYHGMFVVDAGGRLLAAASGHSHTDAFGKSVDIPDPDYAPTGICAAGTDDVAWIYQTDDDLSSFAHPWTVNRYHADGSLSWSYDGIVQPNPFNEFGTIPLDIAGAPDGRIAIVGSFTGTTYYGGWIAMFKP